MYKFEMKKKSPEIDMSRVEVVALAPEGLGFGEGGISVKNQIDQGIITEKVPGYVNEILTQDNHILKRVESGDDGCGDGRAWKRVIQRVGNKVQHFNKSLHRAKVFGGGLVVAGSMWRAIHGSVADGDTVGADRRLMVDELLKHGVSYGAHTDNHATGDDCGCGAIDKYQTISLNVIKYRAEITDLLKVLYGNDYEMNQEAIARVFAVYQELANNDEYFSDGSGKQSMNQILKAGAVVKELEGHHVEETIVINDVPGTTIDQQRFTEMVKKRCQSDQQHPKTIQVFSVDIWRGRDLARAVADIAYGKDSTQSRDELYRLAFADFLIRTLAVAGTLTAGDLPVYQFSQK